MLKLVNATKLDDLNARIGNLELENATLREKLDVSSKALKHYITRVHNQTEVISKVINIGKEKEEKASRNFTRVVSNLQTDTAKTLLFKKLVDSCESVEVLSSWNKILSNSIPAEA